MSAADFFAELMREVEHHPALHHPFLERFARGVDRTQARCFATQHYAYSRMFIRNVAAVLSNTPDENARRLLAINIYEEIGEPLRTRDRAHLLLLQAGLVTEGQLRDAASRANAAGDAVATLIQDGVVSRADVARIVGTMPEPGDLTHTALFVRFLRALDGAPDAPQPTLPATADFIDSTHRLCRSEPWLVGLGALGPGTESIVPSVYRRILSGVEKLEGVKPEDYAFWTIHVHCDESHGRNIIEALRPYGNSSDAARQIRDGAMRMLDARRHWMDGLHRAVFDEPGR